MLSLHKQLESETVDFVATHLLQTLIKCANRKTQMTIFNGTVTFFNSIDLYFLLGGGSGNISWFLTVVAFHNGKGSHEGLWKTPLALCCSWLLATINFHTVAILNRMKFHLCELSFFFLTKTNQDVFKRGKYASVASVSVHSTRNTHTHTLCTSPPAACLSSHPSISMTAAASFPPSLPIGS